MAARRRATPQAATQPARSGRPLIGFLARTGRPVAIGLGVVALAGGAYAVARETSIFAVTKVEVVGGTSRAQAQTRAALDDLVGRSLVKVNRGEIDSRIAAAPDVLSVSFDRAFPNTLRVVVRPERPVLLLRRAADAWVVSARGRVLRKVSRPPRSALPRAWVPKEAVVGVNKLLTPETGSRAAAAVAPLSRGFLGQVRLVRAGVDELTLVLRSGLEIRLGAMRDIRLKLVIARRLIAEAGPFSAAAYMDVSVPERPVVKAGETLDDEVELEA